MSRANDRGGREGDENLLTKYLESGSLSDEEIKKGLRERAVKNEICLVTCGSAFKNKGVQAVLDAIVEYMPSPTEVPPVKGQGESGEPMTRKADDAEPFAALAFKILNDPFVGNLTFSRVYFGHAEIQAIKCLFPTAIAMSASAACCRCMPAIARKWRCRRRYRRRGGFEGRHRRHSLRP